MKNSESVNPESCWATILADQNSASQMLPDSQEKK